MKLKSLFRSKTSLEAEMKEILAGDNASLVAYLIHGDESYKVPHSAFHSLEYTHMRTILSQLKDNVWFKTFSDLRDIEQISLENITSIARHDGKFYARDLVVLKVLHENNGNAWMRVLESCMLDETLPQHDNGRMVLAIVRETECEAPPKPAPPKFDGFKSRDAIYPPPPRAKLNPKPVVNPDHSPVEIIHVSDPVGKPPPPGARLGGPMASAWSGPGGPPPPPGTGYRNFMSCQRADVTPKTPLNDDTAREALTSYKAYTLRPVPAHTSPTDPGPAPRPQWTRCFVTHEHDPTSILQARIVAFKRRGDSIIDLKMQLVESQSAQISRLIDEANRLDNDSRFEHKLVELSMMDRERGLVKRQAWDLHVDVIHIIIERCVKESLSPMTVYNQIHNPPPRVFPPPCPPAAPRGPMPFVEVDRSRRRSPIRYRRNTRRRSVSTYYSDSDSSSYFSDSGSEVLRRRKDGKSKNNHNSDSDSVDEDKPRWKKDPVVFLLDKADKKRDIVEVLLERWTPAGDEKVKVEVTKDEKAEKKKSQKNKRRSKKYVSDSDSSLEF
jgi:hypothetical protein